MGLVGNTKRGKRGCASSAKCRPFETSHISSDDCFAAQIVLFLRRAWRRYGGLAGRPLPSAIRLLSCQVSFHFSLRVEDCCQAVGGGGTCLDIPPSEIRILDIASSMCVILSASGIIRSPSLS